MVDRLLPGVTTVTTHARYLHLHPLVWSEAQARGLDLDAARDLLRRCEVLVAGVSVLHNHGSGLPAAHGADPVLAAIESDGALALGRLQEPGGYSKQVGGFTGTYRGSESRLGLLVPHGDGAAKAGPRFEEHTVRRVLGGLFDLAEHDEVSLDDLRAIPQACVCGPCSGPETRLLQRLLCAPEHSTEFHKPDSARATTARLLGRVLQAGGVERAEEGFSKAVRCGEFILTDPVAASLPESRAWRGVALRIFTVGAWRRLWSLLVDDLDEPRSARELADRFAGHFPDITVWEMSDSLPPSMEDGVVLDAEGDVRATADRDPLVEVQLLALAARRVSDLDGDTLRAFSPRPDEVLGPHWIRDYLESRPRDRLRPVVADLAMRLVDRALRVALSKMRTRPDGTAWIPTRIKERDGLLIRLSREGWADVGMRIESFSNMLFGTGVLEWSSEGYALSEHGEALIG